MGDIKHDYLQSFLKPLKEIDSSAMDVIYRRFENEARTQLAAEAVHDSAMRFIRRLDMRYCGQSHELTLDLPVTLGESQAKMIQTINEAFYEAHQRVYGFAELNEPAEIVNLRLMALGVIRRPTLETTHASGPDASAAIKDHRRVYFEERHALVDCPIYDRATLRGGHHIAGPAIVEEYDSTTVIHPGFTAVVDRFANLIVELS